MDAPRFVWIPESPTHPGLYAVRGGLLASGQNSVHDVAFAEQFPSREECAAWCASNPNPVFVPVEHGFAGKE